MEKMVQKMTGPDARSATALSKEVGVSQGTLSRWLREAKMSRMSNGEDAKGGSGRSGAGSRRRWSPEDKVRVVMEATAIGDDGVGVLLRREGLHDADLERLREEVLRAATDGLRDKGRRRGLSPEQKQVRLLRKELARKDRALAEAAALLVLRGKAEAFFWAAEEGDTYSGSEK